MVGPTGLSLYNELGEVHFVLDLLLTFILLSGGLVVASKEARQGRGRV